MKNIEDSFDSFALDRATSLSTHLSTTHTQYINLSKKCLEYFQEIKEHLPEHVQPILFEYEESISLLNSISQDFMYIHGLKDGSRLIRHFGFDGSLDESSIRRN